MWETLLTRAAAPSQTHRIDLNSYFSILESIILLKSRLIKEYSYSKIELPSLSSEWSIGISNFVDFFQPFQSFSPAPLGSLSLYAWIYICFVSTVFLNHKLLIFFNEKSALHPDAQHYNMENMVIPRCVYAHTFSLAVLSLQYNSGSSWWDLEVCPHPGDPECSNKINTI